MASDDFNRKLTAVFSADAVGYSRLMGKDEAATVKMLESYKKVMFSLIKQHRGRVIDSPGDNLLAEFASVVDAVQCGVAVQKEIQNRNADLPENRRMQFRVGINLGDVIEEEGRIYGDGVNIAARLESLADPGGICVSKTAFDQIESKLPLGYEFIGDQEVKNIAKPVGAYRVLMDPRVTVAEAKDVAPRIPVWRRKKTIAAAIAVLVIIIGAGVWNFYFRPPPIEPASVKDMALPLPDRPSIAVLPFVNMSEDPKQDSFSDGITEDIITALSKTPRLFVIARNSTFVYKGKPVKIQEVAEDLGVRYVLEGSVRKSGNKVRVTAQLIDALKGTHLWAEKYDRDLKDIFAIQDDITRKIITALKVKLTEGEQARIWSRGTENVKALEMAFESLEHFRRFNPDEVILCRKKAKEALALDPNYTFAIGILAWSHLVEVWNGWSKSPRDSMKKAVELADKALTIDENDASSHALLGSIYLAQKKWDKAVEEGERAVELSPSGSDVNGLLGITLSSVGRQKEAISLFEKAIRLNPTAPNWLYQTLARAQILIGNYQDAVISLKRVIEKNHKHLPARRYLIVAYSLSNQDEEAKSQVEEYLKLRPSANIENWKKGANFKNRTDIDLIVNALRKAGLPEKPPPPPVPTKPSIAVLPFANISGDPKEDYLGDGITEQIITALSKIPQMLVIARNSVFTYKGKPVMVQQVGEELGVRYVLEGSFQRSGDRLRVTAQLIDAKTGNHLWSERYDRDLKDLFELQDDITKNVITALQVKLTVGEYASIRSKGTRNLEAYLKVMKADYHLVRYNKDDNEIARKLFEEAIALDPNYSDAYILLAWTYEREAYRRWTKTPRKSYQKAMELAEKAISLDEQKPSAYMLIARLFADAGQIEKAIAMGKKGLSLDPANSLINAFYGMVLNQSAKFKEAIPFYEKAFRTEPKPPWWYWVYLGFSYYWTGQNEKAVSTFKGWVSQQPERAMAYASLGLALIAGGKPEEAVRMFEKALRLQNPPVWCRSNLAIATFGTGKPEEAIKMMNDVASSHPNSGDAYRSLSMVLNFDGKYEEALSMATKAVSLPKTGNKANVAVIYTTLGFSYLMMKQYKEAMSAFKKAIDICPECISGHIDLTAAYSLAGRMEDARAQVAEVLKINPKFSLENIAKSGFYNFQEPDKEHFINALREAGLK